jgi:hypothetical protein
MKFRTRLSLTALETRDNPDGGAPSPYTPPPPGGTPPPEESSPPAPIGPEIPGPYTPPPPGGG